MLSLQFCGRSHHRARATATFCSQTLIKPMQYQHFWLPDQAFAYKTYAKLSLLLPECSRWLPGCSWLLWAAPGCSWLLLAAPGCSWGALLRLLSWIALLDGSLGWLSWIAILDCSAGLLSRIALLECSPGLLSQIALLDDSSGWLS